MNLIARRLGRLALGASLAVALAAPAPAQTTVAAQTPTAPPKQPAPPPKPPAPPPQTPAKPGARGVPAPKGKAAKRPPETRFRLVLNGTLGFTTQSYDDVKTPIVYAEPASIRTSYETGVGFGFDAALQGNFYRGFGALVRFSFVSRDADGTVDVSLPHPLYLNRPRSVSAEISGYGYSESSADLDLAYARTAGKLDWAVFAGVTLFRVEADLLSTPTFDERYPYDELTITATPAASVEGDAIGFNVGGRLDYRLGKSFGVGVQLRYATASVDLAAGPDATEATIDVGGFSVGAGVRFYF